MPADDPTPTFPNDKHLKPRERAEQTDIAFRRIVGEEKRAEDAKTARLREARLKREAEEPTPPDTGEVIEQR